MKYYFSFLLNITTLYFDKERHTYLHIYSIWRDFFSNNLINWHIQTSCKWCSVSWLEHNFIYKSFFFICHFMLFLIFLSFLFPLPFPQLEFCILGTAYANIFSLLLVFLLSTSLGYRTELKLYPMFVNTHLV